MKKITRRDSISKIGIILGGVLVTTSSCKNNYKIRNTEKKYYFPWKWHQLDPETTAHTAYDIYPEGHCMYAVFKSIVGQLGDKYGGPYDSFPFDMMVYGLGGVACWGTLCGALNGAAAAITLFVDPKDRDRTVQHLFSWYETTEIPVYNPGRSKVKIEPVTSKSVLCHISAANWCKKTGYIFDSDERLERCKRLSADTAGKTVEILNKYFDNTILIPSWSNVEKNSCNSCHSPKSDTISSFGNMNCANCHSFQQEHP